MIQARVLITVYSQTVNERSSANMSSLSSGPVPDAGRNWLGEWQALTAGDRISTDRGGDKHQEPGSGGVASCAGIVHVHDMRARSSGQVTTEGYTTSS